MLAYVMDVSLLCVKTLPKNPCRASLVFILPMIWCNVNLSLHEPRSLFLADDFIALSTESLSGVSALCLESRWFNLQLSQVSKCLSVLISCCYPTRPNLILLFYLVISLVKTRRVWKLKQGSHAQLSSLVNLCFSCAMSLP